MPWELTGNSATNSANNFLGTTDNRPLAIRTNQAERMRITTVGNVGIGTTQPGAKLEINNGDLLFKAAAEDPGDIIFQSAGGGQKGRIWSNPSAGAGLFLSSGDNNPRLSITTAGNVGIGTAAPGSRLSVVGPGAPELAGTARSATLVASAGNLGTSAGTELALASLGFSAQGNNVSLGIRGRRAHAGDGWTRTSIGLGMDVDNTVRASEASLWLNAAGGVGIGTATPGSRLTVDVPASSNPLSAMSIDVQSFSTQSNAQASHYFRVRDIGAAPPEGFTHFMIRGDGNVEVAGDIRLLNADCAEDFDVSDVEETEPGSVMVIDHGGALQLSRQAYDKRVAGVVSGAGDYKSAIILDKQDSRADRMPVALMGKVGCKVDAQYSPIGVGDLLTTSPTAGHAMKADNPHRAFGAVLGKALKGLNEGTDTIPVMVALQ